MFFIGFIIIFIFNKSLKRPIKMEKDGKRITRIIFLSHTIILFRNSRLFLQHPEEGRGCFCRSCCYSNINEDSDDVQV